MISYNVFANPKVHVAFTVHCSLQVYEAADEPDFNLPLVRSTAISEDETMRKAIHDHARYRQASE